MFKAKFDLEKRKMFFRQMTTESFKGMIPVIIQPNPRSQLPALSNIKFLIEKNVSIGDFQQIIRRRLIAVAKAGDNAQSLNERDSLFFFYSDNKAMVSNMNMGEVYANYKDNQDEFLYVFYQEQQAFGQ